MEAVAHRLWGRKELKLYCCNVLTFNGKWYKISYDLKMGKRSRKTLQ